MVPSPRASSLVAAFAALLVGFGSLAPQSVDAWQPAGGEPGHELTAPLGCIAAASGLPKRSRASDGNLAPANLCVAWHEREAAASTVRSTETRVNPAPALTRWQLAHGTSTSTSP